MVGHLLLRMFTTTLPFCLFSLASRFHLVWVVGAGESINHKPRHQRLRLGIIVFQSYEHVCVKPIAEFCSCIIEVVVKPGKTQIGGSVEVIASPKTLKEVVKVIVLIHD